MNRLLVMAGAILILFLSGGILVVTPYFSILRHSDMSVMEENKRLSESVARGRKVYIDLGCVYCHSQQPRHKKFGPDYERGWGYQPNAEDYLGQNPHQLGTARTGPDLFNIGDRNPSFQWNLIHLYNPRIMVPWSIMPAYPFLFEERKIAQKEEEILRFDWIGITREKQIIPTKRALDLVHYLQSLKQGERKQ